MTLKRVALTNIVVSDLSRNASQKQLTEAWQSQNILGKWKESTWAKKLENKKKRADMNDFDRFKLMVAKKQKSKIVGAKELAGL